MKRQLEIFITAARQRAEAMDHVLIFGPPGLGKTTLANIIAVELGVNLRQTSGPVLERPADLAAQLTNLQPRDVLFIDEIHRLSPIVEEVLYPALEDCQLDIMIGEGPAARSIKLKLAPFTLVGATTRAGLLTSPLRDRFGIVQRLEFYSVEDLQHIVTRSAGILEVPIVARGRAPPSRSARAARRALPTGCCAGCAISRRCGPMAASMRRIAIAALGMLDIDHQGFDALDRKVLRTIIEKFDGGPVGIDSIAAAIGEERGTLEDVIEPFLIQQGFLMRTARGRMATRTAYLHLGLPYRPMSSATLPIFEEERVKVFSWRTRVYWEDTDAGGVVYYANYLRFMERARTEWLRTLGFCQRDLANNHGVLFAVTRVRIDYRRPARLDDELSVTCEPRTVGAASVSFAQNILRVSRRRGPIPANRPGPLIRRRAC